MNAPAEARRQTEDVTIFICSCDDYEDCWSPFFTLLERYWPEAASYPVILNTESKVYQRAGWDIKCFQLYGSEKKVSYGTRMIQHLKRVETPLLLLLLDDFFLRAPVDTKRLKDCIKGMIADDNITCFNFASVDQPGFPSEAYAGFQELYPIADYRLNMQAALWRTKDLLSYWKPGASPWAWELFCNRRTHRTKKKFYFLEKNALRIINYGHKPDLTWGCVRGKWCREDVVPLFEKEKIEFDFSKRGWFNLDAFLEEQKEKAPKQTLWKRIKLLVMECYLGGMVFSLKRLCYSTWKRIRGLPDGYVRYMKKKYNPKTAEALREYEKPRTMG